MNEIQTVIQDNTVMPVEETFATHDPSLAGYLVYKGLAPLSVERCEVYDRPEIVFACSNEATEALGEWNSGDPFSGGPFVNAHRFAAALSRVAHLLGPPS